MLSRLHCNNIVCIRLPEPTYKNIFNHHMKNARSPFWDRASKTGIRPLVRCRYPCCSQEDMVMDRFDFSPLFRSTIGFDRLTRLVDAATRVDSAAVAYPPYNIEKTGEDAYRLTMAVAGFSPAEVDITVQENTLLVTGKAQKEDENSGAYLHRGIARRTFERRFSLADHMKVVGASLDNGLLYVDVVRELPEAAKPRTIKIGTAVETVQPQVTEQKAQPQVTEQKAA